MPIWLIGLSALFLFSGVVAGESVKAVTDRLVALGYDASVAKRIVSLRPDLVEIARKELRDRVSKDQSRLRPRALYRGVRLTGSLAEYDPGFPGQREPDGRFIKFFSRDKQGTAARYMSPQYLWDSRPHVPDPGRLFHGLLLEFQIPIFFIEEHNDNRKKGQAALNSWVNVLNHELVPDDTPFIRQISTRLWNDGKKVPGGLASFSYDQAFAEGRIDEGRLFRALKKRGKCPKGFAALDSPVR